MDVDTMTEEELVLHLLGRRIADTRRIIAREREYSNSDPDKMDDTIKKGQKELQTLLRVRRDLERVFFGEVGDEG